MKRHGLIWCAAFVILDAVQAVYAGAVLQKVDAFLLGAAVFGPPAAATLLWAAWRSPGQLAAALARPHDLIGLNISAALGWAAYLAGIQFIEPAVAFALFSGIIPLVTLAAGRFGVMLAGKTTGRTEGIGHAVLAVGIGTLALLTLSGHSGFVREGADAAMAGLGLVLVGGGSIGAMLLFGKRLDRHGVGPAAQFGLRFPLYLLVATMGASQGWEAKPPVAPTELATVLAIGLAVLAFPIYAVQKAISLVSPLTIAIAAATTPVITFLLQIPEGRVSFAPATLAGLTVCFAGALLAAVGRAQSARALVTTGHRDADDGGGEDQT